MVKRYKRSKPAPRRQPTEAPAIGWRPITIDLEPGRHHHWLERERVRITAHGKRCRVVLTTNVRTGRPCERLEVAE
jgi:hypothetical protein